MNKLTDITRSIWPLLSNGTLPLTENDIDNTVVYKVHKNIILDKYLFLVIFLVIPCYVYLMFRLSRS
jgi:hypothetical protein